MFELQKELQEADKQGTTITHEIIVKQDDIVLQ